MESSDSDSLRYIGPSPIEGDNLESCFRYQIGDFSLREQNIPLNLFITASSPRHSLKLELAHLRVEPTESLLCLPLDSSASSAHPPQITTIPASSGARHPTELSASVPAGSL